MAKKSKKHQSKSDEGGIVFSTKQGWNPFAELNGLNDATESDDTNDAILSIHYEKKGRNGKPVTIVKGWASEAELENHGKALKQLCGVGGSAKDGELLLQGDQRKHVETYASERELKTKRIGG